MVVCTWKACPMEVGCDCFGNVYTAYAPSTTRICLECGIHILHADPVRWIVRHQHGDDVCRSFVLSGDDLDRYRFGTKNAPVFI